MIFDIEIDPVIFRAIQISPATQGSYATNNAEILLVWRTGLVPSAAALNVD